jgi:hypothetical protein
LHYATAARQREIVMFLLSEGASTILTSKNGTTAKDIAEKYNLVDLLDAFTSKMNMENDPYVPQFRDWLNCLGGGEYLTKFIDAGYDFRFIKSKSLTETDLDCVGIPLSKMGLRRKLLSLHLIENLFGLK